MRKAKTTTGKPPATTTTSIRTLKPTAQMPTAAVLRRLREDDRNLFVDTISSALECVYHPSFRRATVPGAEYFDDQPTTLGRLGPPRLLTAEEERTLFLRYNYCRNRVMRTLRKYANRRLDAAGTADVILWQRRAEQTRGEIVNANTALVLAMARRSRNATVELGELVAEGNLAMVRCVAKFDASRGFKFSTYACRAILASFARIGAQTTRYRTRFPATYDPSLERSDHLDRTREEIESDYLGELRGILATNSASLSNVERRVLDARFMLAEDAPDNSNQRRRTLGQVGLLLGVSKERVRQIQNQAMGKLRSALERSVAVAS